MDLVYLSVAGVVVLIILTTVLIFTIKKLNSVKAADNAKSAQLESFASIIDAEAEAQRLISQADSESQAMVNAAKAAAALMEQKATGLLTDAQKTSILIQQQIQDLRSSYVTKKGIYDDLEKAIAIYREDADFAEMGAYEPHFNFDTSEEFKDAVRENRQKQKALLRIKDIGGAIWCGTEWQVHNSRSEGKRMTTRGINLTARAFNGECDAAIANCTFKNWSVMHDRIHAAFNKINSLNEVNDIHISQAYLQLKLKELDLVHEYKIKKQDEKEEQREIRAQMAEERKAQQEIDRAIQEAEVEEARAQKALDKARKEMESKLAIMTAEQAKAYQEKIAVLQEALTEAELKGQKALSLAQQTKRGHVYIISNLGAFGENVFKIGMTRRLDPQDRIDELGSASVPFLFDVHAMIHCEDAPTLENTLHQRFNERRTNLVNKRKEFFNVSMKDIKNAVYEIAGSDVDFIETASAQHYHETLAIRKKIAEHTATTANLPVQQPRFADAI
ncbi:DUF4041 domain-containing protein [Edaphovirga cremea]|uniref:DUF4041 domain-containing protein n=1 Tax=Edaphovirga cremea TaxID=2267246 RepID=UPI000DEF8344|nr:DUF4041 domain-containing protein [Edaphovirga cremea]